MLDSLPSVLIFVDEDEEYAGEEDNHDELTRIATGDVEHNVEAHVGS